MSRLQDQYKDFDDRHRELEDEAWANAGRDDDDEEKWSTQEERNSLENRLDSTQREIQGREEAREAWRAYGDDNGGHDERIEGLRDQEQLEINAIAHYDGEYEYATPMREGNDEVHRELEEENDARWARQEEGKEDERGDALQDEEESSDMDLDEYDYDDD